MNKAIVLRGTIGLAVCGLWICLAMAKPEQTSEARDDRPIEFTRFENISAAPQSVVPQPVVPQQLLAFHPDTDEAKTPAAQQRVGAIKAEGQDVRLTKRDTEDDQPALARGADGTLWLAYVEYTPGQPIVMEQAIERRFDSLIPKGNGDRLRLMRFDGTAWQHEVDITGKGRDIWRPTIAVDGNGNVIVAWPEKREEAWDIFYKKYEPSKSAGTKGKLSDRERLTDSKGTDHYITSTTDARGEVWLAWQGWNVDNFDILVARLGKQSDKPQKVSDAIPNTKANEWAPAMTADSKGNVYVAWDTYDKGNYDIRVQVLGKTPRTLTAADSLLFEARPAVACDQDNRLWVAYEEGNQLWGKDFSSEQFRKVGFERNPGFGLYQDRTIRVKCFSDGDWTEPAVNLKSALAGTLDRNTSVPRLAFDGAGGLWLLFRHHPKANGGGEVWMSYAIRYAGDKWSTPIELPDSMNLMDNRPALALKDRDVMVVYSGDGRSSARNHDQDDLFQFLLTPPEESPAPKLVQAQPPKFEEMQPVHPNEPQDIARIRRARLTVDGKGLRPIRGEFHRHTEYTAHRDGDGLLEDSYRYALDAGNLDWMGNGDHDNGFGFEYMWWQIQKICDLYHNPPNFTAVLTHERSMVYPSGHRNVMLPERGIRPLPRIDPDRNGDKLQLFGTPEGGSPDIKMLYDYLKHFDGICSSHTSGTNMGTDWRDNDPEVEPIVEIYQGHRHNYEHFGAPRSATEQTAIGGYRPAGFIWNALERGYKLGFQSSSDHVSTHMSYAIVLVEEPSRDGILDAFKKRHSYAATDNILLIVRSREHLMGDEFATSSYPELDIQIRGTSDITNVQVVRNNKYVFTTQPKGPRAEFRFRDIDARPGESYYYYVRVEQADGNLAWGSPMWITYRPDRS